MAIYVQGLSALAYYRNGGLATEVERTSSQVRSLEEATSSRTEIVDAGIWRLGIGEPTEERPLEVLLHDAGQRTRSRAVHARVWAGPLAPTSLRTVRKGIFVSSPEFVFLQLATKLSLPELVALGMELCGTYRRNVELPRADGVGITLTTAYQQSPLSNPQRLRGFISSMKSAPGQARALKAMRYVLPNSASPMETALYLLLCLPRRLGGYALPKPTLNPSIVFTKSGRKYTLKSFAKPDLYWKGERLDLEYDSDEFHDDSTRAFESMRRKALERMKVEVIGLTPEELFSTSLLHATAMRIARRLKRRIRAEHEGSFVQSRFKLRQALLFSDVTAPPHIEDADADKRASYETAGESHTDIGLHDEAIWIDEIPDAGPWEQNAWDIDDSWAIEVTEPDGRDLHVFGGGRFQAE